MGVSPMFLFLFFFSVFFFFLFFVIPAQAGIQGWTENDELRSPN